MLVLIEIAYYKIHATYQHRDSIAGLKNCPRVQGCGVRFLTALGVVFFPTPEVQFDCFFYIILLCWVLLLKWYNFF